MAQSQHQLIASGLHDWVAATQLRVFPVAANPECPVLDGSCFRGSCTTILRLETQGLSRALFRNHPGRLSLVFSEAGLCRGHAGGRPFRAVPNRFTCLLLPEEVLDLQVSSPRFVGFVIQLPVEIGRAHV